MDAFGDAVILCGGKSSRMGFDKSLLKIDGEYVIDIMARKLGGVFARVSLGTAPDRGQETLPDRDKFGQFGLPIIEDIYEAGPAGAIHAALACAQSRYVFVVAVDMPLINIHHIQHMMDMVDGDALIPMNNGHAEPMYGFYSTAALPIFEQEIAKDNLTIYKILAKLNTAYFDEAASRRFDPELSMFTNLNYIEDLEVLA